MLPAFRHHGRRGRCVLVCITLLLLGLVTQFWAHAGGAGPTDKTARTPVQFFRDQIQPFLAKHCLACHGPDKSKGDFRVDRLDPEFSDAATSKQWHNVLRRVQAGEMPPKSQPRPSAEEIRVFTDWITGQVRAAEAARGQGRVVLRRLNRVEYENTLRDLLGIEIDVRDLLPLDSSAAGFDNVGEALHVSPFLLEKYLEAADKALNLAIANGPQPPLVKKRYSLAETHQVKVTTEKVFRKHEDGTVVMFSSSPWQAVIVSPFYPPDRGTYRFRICASAVQSDGKPVTYRIQAGTLGMAGKSHLVGYFDAPAGEPAVVEFVDHLEARSSIRIHPHGLASAQAVHKIGAADYTGPGLAVHWVEVEGPLHDIWPPESHRRLFGALPQKPAPSSKSRNRVEVVSENPEADARHILLRFARRAFRRTVTDDDIKPYFALVKAKLAENYGFEKAVRVGLKGILLAPDFLFLREKSLEAANAGPLDDFSIASRLSYFLWSSMPDDELLDRAEQKKLREPKTLAAQVERLLQSPKAAAFTENFVGQWLNLREIDATVPSHILYPEYDEMLKESMLRETYLFFDEVLKNDLSLAHFVHSDFSMLDGRLAKHYGIPFTPVASGKKGAGDSLWEFRKVKLPPDSHRGGVLTMASVLKVTANGTYTSPILRGAFVLDRVLGTPPPPPPEGVAAVDPDIRGATTIREQLAKHRSDAVCANCHAKIDPPGFALESFDVIGSWRDFYRTSGNGKPVTIDGKKMLYREGKKVDPADVMPDGQRFANIDEFKQILLKDRDQLARALATRLVTYATGAPPRLADQAAIEDLVRQARTRNYGLRTLVHALVQSDLFRRK